MMESYPSGNEANEQTDAYVLLLETTFLFQRYANSCGVQLNGAEPSNAAYGHDEANMFVLSTFPKGGTGDSLQLWYYFNDNKETITIKRVNEDVPTEEYSIWYDADVQKTYWCGPKTDKSHTETFANITREIVSAKWHGAWSQIVADQESLGSSVEEF